MGLMRVSRRFKATGTRGSGFDGSWFPLIYKSISSLLSLFGLAADTYGYKQKKAQAHYRTLIPSRLISTP
jgi:hypothetical protein